jgi:hypothetical protein
MATVVQEADSGAGFSTSATFAFGTTAHNAVVIGITNYNGGAAMTPIAPSLGGSSAGMVELGFEQSPTGPAQAVAIAFYLLPDVGAGLTAIGAPAFTNGTSVSVLGWEVAGLGTSATLDQSAAGQGNSATVAAGPTGAIAASGEFVACGGVAYGQSVAAPGAPWTGAVQMASLYAMCAYQLPSSPGGTYSFSSAAGASTPWAALIVTVKNPASVAASSGLLMACYP